MILPADEEIVMSGDHDQRSASGHDDGADDDHQHSAHGDRPTASGRFRRLELIMGEPRRRRWSREEKARITALSFEPGCNVSALARTHGVSVGLLHYWRRVARERASDGAMSFVPLMTAEAVSADLIATCDPAKDAPESSSGSIVLELHGVRILVSSRVDRAALASVLMAVRASA
jgi:transposase